MNQLSEAWTHQVCRSMQTRQLLWTETTHTHTHTKSWIQLLLGISSGNVTMKATYGRHFTSHAFCFKPFTHCFTGTVTFCLAVCYLLQYFIGEALWSLSYLLSIPHDLQQQDMTNKIMKHM